MNLFIVHRILIFWASVHHQFDRLSALNLLELEHGIAQPAGVAQAPSQSIRIMYQHHPSLRTVLQVHQPCCLTLDVTNLSQMEEIR